jgi:predicted phage terminase large subunit-like protein
MPPRHGKSFLSTVYFPAWYLGKFPGSKIVTSSATQELACEFTLQSRDIFTEWGEELFGQGIRADVHAKDHWETSTGGSLRAIGAGSSIYGRGANLFLIDDYFGKIEQALSEAERKRIHAWYYGTIRNRLEPDGVIVVVASRTHPDDLNGKLIADSLIGGEEWKRYRLPAINAQGQALWPERFDIDALRIIQRGYESSGFPWMWDALFQQDPPDVLDSEWSADYFREHIWYTDAPEPSTIIWRVMTLDPSVGESEKSDFSALIMLAVDKNLDLWVEADIQRRDVVRQGLDGLMWYRRFHPREWGVETVAFQKVLKGEFQREAERQKMLVQISGITHPPRSGKRERIRATITPALAQHRLHFQRGSPGCAMLVEQLKGFPTCKYDDGPDALEMALTLAARAVNIGRAFGSEGIQRANDMMERMHA